jgi:hypothetical protein
VQRRSRVPVPHLTRHWSGRPKRWRVLPAAHRQRSGLRPGKKTPEDLWTEPSGRPTQRAQRFGSPTPGTGPEGGVRTVRVAAGERGVTIPGVPSRTTPAGGPPGWPTQQVRGGTPCAALRRVRGGGVAHGPAGEGPWGVAGEGAVRLPAGGHRGRSWAGLRVEASAQCGSPGPGGRGGRHPRSWRLGCHGSHPVQGVALVPGPGGGITWGGRQYGMCGGLAGGYGGAASHTGAGASCWGGVPQGGAWGQAQWAGRWGWSTMKRLSPHGPEQAAASDGQKRPLRSRFWPRLSRGVRWL